MNNPNPNWNKVDPAAVADCSKRHIRSVLEDAIETIQRLTEDKELMLAYARAWVVRYGKLDTAPVSIWEYIMQELEGRRR